MTRQFMVGTVDDTPLLIVVVEGVKYFVDLVKKKVFFDMPGTPEVTDDLIIAKVLKASESTD